MKTDTQDATTRTAPFKLPLQNGGYGDDIIDAAGNLTIQLYGDERVPDTLEQREYLIRAVNAFDDMLAALKAVKAIKEGAALKSTSFKLEALIEIGKLLDAAIAKVGGQ